MFWIILHMPTNRFSNAQQTAVLYVFFKNSKKNTFSLECLKYNRQFSLTHNRNKTFSINGPTGDRTPALFLNSK